MQINDLFTWVESNSIKKIHKQTKVSTDHKFDGGHFDRVNYIASLNFADYIKPFVTSNDCITYYFDFLSRKFSNLF